MAAYEVLLLNTAIPQIQAAQSGDTYVVPRDIAFSAALTLSAGTANGVPYLNGSKVLTSGSALTFDGLRLTVGGSDGTNFAAKGATKGIRFDFDGTTSTIYGVDNTFFGSYEPLAIGGSYVTFKTSGSEQMRLTSTGLGIGTSSPGYKLDVESTTANPTVRIRSNGGVIGNYAELLLQSFNSFSGVGQAYIRGISTASGNSNTALTFGVNGPGFGAPFEAMRLDTSGNLGLGVTPSAWSGGFKVFAIGGNNVWSTDDANTLYFTQNSYFDGAFKYQGSGYSATRHEMANGTFKWYTAPSGTAGNAITFTQAMTLDASGNLGVGQTSPTAKLHIYEPTAAATRIRVLANGGQQAALQLAGNGTTFGTTSFDVFQDGGSDAYVANRANASLQFWTNNTERARITSDGDFYLGTQTALGGPGKFNLSFNQSTNFGITLRNTNATATGVFVSFENSGGTGNGSISQTNSTTVAYNTSSDRRLKKNILPAPQAGADIDAIEIVSHEWIGNDDIVKYGVVAQDLQTVAPQAVSAGDNNEEIERTWGVDYSKLVPMLIKEIQSLRARVKALEGA